MCVYVYESVFICPLEVAHDFIARRLIATVLLSKRWGWDLNEVAFYWFNSQSQEATSLLQHTAFLHRCVCICVSENKRETEKLSEFHLNFYQLVYMWMKNTGLQAYLKTLLVFAPTIIGA